MSSPEASIPLWAEIASEMLPRFKEYLHLKETEIKQRFPTIDEDTLKKLLHYESDIFFSRLQLALTLSGLEEDT